MNKPVDAQVFFDGSFYKVGLHGHAYMWVNGEWKRSQKEAKDIEKAIKKKASGA